MISEPSSPSTNDARAGRSQAFFVAAILSPAVLAPIWVGAWRLTTLPRGSFVGSFAGLTLFLVAAVAAYTDCRWRLIPNWVTYAGAMWGIGINAAASVVYPDGDFPSWMGAVGLSNSLLGFGGLFLLFLVTFSFTGGGAGDVKLAGGIGSLVGLELGLTVMIVSFIAAGIILTVWGIWKEGPWKIALTLGRQFGNRVAPAWVNPPSADQLQTVMQPVPLAPFFAIGVMIACGSVSWSSGTLESPY